MTAPPRLTRVDAGGNRHALGLGHNEGIGPAEGAVEEPRVVGDVVHRGENGRRRTRRVHTLAQLFQTGLVFLGRERQLGLLAIVETVVFRT